MNYFPTGYPYRNSTTKVITATTRIISTTTTTSKPNALLVLSNATNPYEQFDETIFTVFTVLYWLLCVIGFIGNALVIHIIAKNRKMQTITNIHICNLAIIDALIMLGLPLHLNKEWTYGYVMCKSYVSLTAITDFAGCLAIASLSLDRCFAICFPFAAVNYRTKFTAICFCATVWIISILFSAPVIYWSDLRVLNPNISTEETCNTFWGETDYMSGQEAFFLYTHILGFCFPFVVIVASYVMVLLKIRKTTFDQSARRVQKVTKFVAIVISVYLICWSPYWLIGIIYAISSIERSGPMLLPFITAEYISYMYSALNPLLYASVNPNFKVNLIKVFVCLLPRNVKVQSEDSDYGTDGGSMKMTVKKRRKAYEDQTFPEL
ncbi:somatostatin receptor type 5-like protein [Dinothrombium tinctorium]|uniref:Somatostatin receptor type 5-like protein n=1 Tax=Dinothrombium tinctorium TaxID=1965070 RepID=A0A443RAX5_9ACAR|nr:somatostatin receptor type 5-like protein [Dinothrombium tinctorium]